jgi:hypothetical protein
LLPARFSPTMQSLSLLLLHGALARCCVRPSKHNITETRSHPQAKNPSGK